MPSGAKSRRLPEPWTFFIDRSIGGRIVADALRAAGESVETHDTYFAKNADDITWLPFVGSKGWVVLSKDDRIRRNDVERNALLAARVAAFFLGRSDLTGTQMADTFIAALGATKRALRRFDIPFIARINAGGEVSVFEAGQQRFSPPKVLKA